MTILPLLVLRALLRKEAWHKYKHLVTDETFSSLQFRRIYTHLSSLHAQTAGDITPSALMADLEIAYAGRPEFLGELIEIVQDISETDDLDVNLLGTKITEFVQREFAAKAAEYVATHMHTSAFDVHLFNSLAARALDVSGRVGGEVIDFNKAPISRSTDAGSVRFNLGYSPQLDSDLAGGIGSGELSILLAPPMRGKTSLLCAAGANAARQGNRVLHISLEIRTEMVVRRYDQALTHFRKEGLEQWPEQVQTARQRITEAGGAVWIKDWSHAAVSALDIEAQVRQMRARGEDVNYIIIDYMELMVSSTPARGKDAQARHSYSAIGQEVRALAVRLGVPVLTAWQVNRAGSDTTVLTAKDISECWDIIKHADTIIGINQTDAEHLANRMRLNIIKQRQDTSRGQYELYSDLRRMIVRPVTEEDHREFHAIPQPSDAAAGTPGAGSDNASA